VVVLPGGAVGADRQRGEGGRGIGVAMGWGVAIGAGDLRRRRGGCRSGRGLGVCVTQTSGRVQWVEERLVGGSSRAAWKNGEAGGARCGCRWLEDFCFFFLIMFRFV
jgi:hypothetical protein